jgi:N-methylhydantoinase B
MTTIDPVTFQIIRHKLFNIVEESIIALKNVSGSAITNEGHDLMVSLYRADGGLLVGGVGFLHHLLAASRAVKHLLETYSEDPGIDEDDLFLLNDPYTAALHAPDVYALAPIHYHGQLVAFVANFVHVTDIGGMDPGGFCPRATECYQEGFRTKGIKLIERGRLRRDVYDTILNLVRDPGLTGLDIRSQIAACNVATMRMRALLDEYGVETVDTVSLALINQSEELLRQRLRQLPNGTWRARQYVDSSDEIFTVSLALSKRDDRLIFDFTGSSRQAPYGTNCTYGATVGALFAPLFPLLCYDIVWNDGVSKPVEVIAPEGSIVNCRFPAPISINTVGVIQIVNNLSTFCLSKMLSASPEFRNEATAVWHGSHAHIELHGVNQYGYQFVSPLTDTFAGAGGARTFQDGVELGGEIPNLVSRWANVETHELVLPILYLYRRLVPDSGGPGKYRGGVCHEYAFTRRDSSEVGFVTFGKGVHVPMSYGIEGGYPGCCTDFLKFKGTELWQEAEHKGLPFSLGSTPGTPEPAPWGIYELHEGEVMYIRFMGGGGYGDPLDRDPEAVLRDSTLGFISEKSAREIYGVILDPIAQVVNLGATRELRRALRRQRLATATRGDERVALCPQCDGQEMRQRPVVMREGSLSQAGPLRSGDQRFVLREFFCPSCATMVEVEVALKNDPVLQDEIEN